MKNSKLRGVILLSVRFYQRYLSLDSGYLHAAFPVKICRFHPTCSEYTYQAIDRYGILYGLWLGAGRILRCNPWNKGGYDPLPKESNK